MPVFSQKRVRAALTVVGLGAEPRRYSMAYSIQAWGGRSHEKPRCPHDDCPRDRRAHRRSHSRGGRRDGQVTGQAKEVTLDRMHGQVVPTEEGVFIVIGELVRDQPATVMLLEGARPVQLRVAGDWKTMVVHRELEEALTATTQRLANTP
jgi:hypothetical protein